MDKKSILITDSLFILTKHEKLIKNAGFEIERIDNPKLTEDELCTAIKGKVGYILGGIEIVTNKVIENADKLKAIVFTGTGYTEFITAHKEATEKGILISNAPGGNADAVAEYTISLMMMMNRELLNLGRTGKSNFKTTTSLKDKTIGIIGLGKIGLFVANILRNLGIRDIIYFSQHRKFHYESGLGIKFVTKDDLLSRSDIVSIHISKEAGDKFITSKELNLMKNDSILINTAFPEAVDLKELNKLLKSGKIRAAFDKQPLTNFSDIPDSNFFYSNAQTGFNTTDAIETVSEMATRSIINLLTKHDDAFCVNQKQNRWRNI